MFNRLNIFYIVLAYLRLLTNVPEYVLLTFLVSSLLVAGLIARPPIGGMQVEDVVGALVLFLIFSFIMNGVADIRKLLRIYHSPSLFYLPISFFISLINMLSIAPALALSLSQLSGSPHAALHLVWLGLSIVSIGWVARLLSAALACVVALAVGGPAAPHMVLFAVLVPALYIVLAGLRRLPMVVALSSFGYAGFGPYHVALVLASVAALVAAGHFVDAERSVSASISPVAYSFGVRVPPDVAALAVALFLISLVLLLPVLFVGAARYVDAYIPHLLAIRGVPSALLARRGLFHALQVAAIACVLAMVDRWSFLHVGHVLAFAAAGVFAGVLMPARLERDGDVARVFWVYLAVLLASGYALWRGGVWRGLDLALAAAWMLAALLLYRLPALIRVRVRPP